MYVFLIIAYGSDLTNNFVTAFSQSLPTYDAYDRQGDDLPPPY